MRYIATIRHPGISRARQIERPTLAAAKRAATAAFSDEQNGVQIVIFRCADGAEPVLVAHREVQPIMGAWEATFNA